MDSWCHWAERCHIALRFPDPWWRHRMETFSALLEFCEGNSPVTGEFPAQRPVTRVCFRWSATEDMVWLLTKWSMVHKTPRDMIDTVNRYRESIRLLIGFPIRMFPTVQLAIIMGDIEQMVSPGVLSNTGYPSETHRKLKSREISIVHYTCLCMYVCIYIYIETCVHTTCLISSKQRGMMTIRIWPTTPVDDPIILTLYIYFHLYAINHILI